MLHNLLLFFKQFFHNNVQRHYSLYGNRKKKTEHVTLPVSIFSENKMKNLTRTKKSCYWRREMKSHDEVKKTIVWFCKSKLEYPIMTKLFPCFCHRKVFLLHGIPEIKMCNKKRNIKRIFMTHCWENVMEFLTEWRFVCRERCFLKKGFFFALDTLQATCVWRKFWNICQPIN